MGLHEGIIAKIFGRKREGSGVRPIGVGVGVDGNCPNVALILTR